MNRFPIQIKLAAYSKTDMASIVEKICQEKKIKIDEKSIYKIAAFRAMPIHMILPWL